MQWTNLKPLDLSKIENIEFPDNKYFHEEFEKKQIVIHHTVGSNVEGAVSAWIQNKDNVATCIIIDKNGIPWQLFSSKYWAYHLATGNHNLDRHSIAVELVNVGWLIKGDGTTKMFGNPSKAVKTISGKYYTYYGSSVAVPLQEYPNGFRGYNYYEKYSDQQIRTIGELILYWHVKYNIPLDYNSDMWDVSPRALNGTPGIWGHTSYRPASQKTDPHPQPELIKMLQTLKGLTI